VFAAPVVFFCQNNQWAISTPMERQSRIPLHRRAAGFGFPGIRVDGNDVLATYAVTKAALKRARMGHGPTLIEAVTYRMGAHTTSDDPARYRIESDVEAWRLKDPIARMKSYLTRLCNTGQDFFDTVDQESDELAKYVRRGCQEMPDPQPLSMFDNVYAEHHPVLARERDAFAAYLDSFRTEH
jgi:2-oxoisovalerate dehydrogenase E1 component alpha subunit